jgi:hypothetical protein
VDYLKKIKWNIFTKRPQDSEKILYEFVKKIHQETTRFSNTIGKGRFYMILVITFTTRPRENLVVG